MVATWNVDHLMKTEKDFKAFVFSCLERYKKCDWGDLDPEDKALNDKAIETGESRILASYAHSQYSAWNIWIITEWDRSSTTILFPSEY